MPIQMRARRFALRIDVSYRPEGGDRWLEAHTLNVSRTGVLLECDRAAPVGTPLEFLLKLGPPVADISCSGTVVRAVPPAADAAAWQVGATISSYGFQRTEPPSA